MARALLVLDEDRRLRYIQVCSEVADLPDFKKALEAAKR